MRDIEHITGLIRKQHFIIFQRKKGNHLPTRVTLIYNHVSLLITNSWHNGTGEVIMQSVISTGGSCPEVTEGEIPNTHCLFIN